jgi:hypothetical protein
MIRCPSGAVAQRQPHLDNIRELYAGRRTMRLRPALIGFSFGDAGFAFRGLACVLRMRADDLCGCTSNSLWNERACIAQPEPA